MTSTPESRIARLQKSTQNVLNARNPAQREAAQTFLSMRAQELVAERDTLAAWLDEADSYIADRMPEINTDPEHEYNAEWLAQLALYQQMCDALQHAWHVFTGQEAA